MKILEDEFLCSYDHQSLFTNVPLYENIEMCLENMYSLLKCPKLPKHDFKKLLEFSTKEPHLLFDIYVQCYDQIGVALSSPLIHLMINDIFLCAHLKKNGLKVSGLQFYPKSGCSTWLTGLPYLKARNMR